MLISWPRRQKLVSLRLAALVVIAVSTLGLDAAAPARAERIVTETEAVDWPGGRVEVELKYDERAEIYSREGVPQDSARIRIARNGAVVHDALVPAPCDICPVNPDFDDPTRRLQLVDLDGDNEPEVIVQLRVFGGYGGEYTHIYGYRPGAGSYRRVKRYWFFVSYALEDLDGDRIPEFRSQDVRFPIRPPLDTLMDEGPLQILAYRDGRLLDVTRRFPALIALDARHWRRAYRKYRGRFEAEGALVNYVAAKHLLGQGDGGFELAYLASRRGELGSDRLARRFIRELRALLIRTGYR